MYVYVYNIQNLFIYIQKKVRGMIYMWFFVRLIFRLHRWWRLLRLRDGYLLLWRNICCMLMWLYCLWSWMTLIWVLSELLFGLILLRLHMRSITVRLTFQKYMQNDENYVDNFVSRYILYLPSNLCDHIVHKSHSTPIWN